MLIRLDTRDKRENYNWANVGVSYDQRVDTLAAMQAKRLDIIHIERGSEQNTSGISNGCVNRSRESFKILDISIEVLRVI